MPTALYAFGILSRQDHPQATLPEEQPARLEPDAPLELLSLDPLPFLALCAPTSPQTWTGPDAEPRLADLQWVGPRALAHEEITRWSHLHFSPFVPFSLGTIFSSPQTLRDALTPQVEILQAYFDLTRDSDQWTLKGYIDPDQLTAASSQEPSPSSGADYLRRRRSAPRQTTLDERLQIETRNLFDQLLPLASAHQIATTAASKKGGTHCLFHWHFLIPREDSQAFLSSLDEAIVPLAPFQLDLHLQGPLPPYHFR